MSIGHVINAFRRQHGWSQTELAQRVGCDQGYISRLERNQASPSLSVAKTLADTFGCTIDDLVQAIPASPALPPEVPA